MYSLHVPDNDPFVCADSWAAQGLNIKGGPSRKPRDRHEIGMRGGDNESIGELSEDAFELPREEGGCSDSSCNCRLPDKSPDSGIHLFRQDVRLKGLPGS